MVRFHFNDKQMSPISPNKNPQPFSIRTTSYHKFFQISTTLKKSSTTSQPQKTDPKKQLFEGASAGQAQPLAGRAGWCGISLVGHCGFALPALPFTRGWRYPRTECLSKMSKCFFLTKTDKLGRFRTGHEITKVGTKTWMSWIATQNERMIDFNDQFLLVVKCMIGIWHFRRAEHRKTWR